MGYIIPTLNSSKFLNIMNRVSDPYSFFTDPDPDPEDPDVGQYGSGSNTDPGFSPCKYEV